MATEKLDLLKDYCAVYDENMQLVKTINRTVGEFNTMFDDTCDLVTLNLNIPIKRAMKFYGIKDAVPNAFVELPYADMTDEQKAVFDNFVIEANA